MVWHDVFKIFLDDVLKISLNATLRVDVYIKVRNRETNCEANPREKRHSIMAQGSSGKDVKMYTVCKHFLIEVLIYNIISFSCTYADSIFL